MDAWIRNLMKSMSFASGSRDPAAFEPEILLCKRGGRSSSSSGSAVVVVSGAASLSVRTPPSEPSAAGQHTRSSPHRIAHWDKKREKCRNCALIYLKTLSRHPGFCSVDCKSNATYLEKVNRTIRAMKDAVEQRQHEKDAVATHEAQAEPVVEKPQPAQDDEVEDEVSPVEDEDDEDEDDRAQPQQSAHTFSEFGLESRILDASNVEWAFSALY